MSSFPLYGVKMVDEKDWFYFYSLNYYNLVYLVPKLLIQSIIYLKLLILVYEVQLMAFIKIINEKSYHV